MSDTKYSISYLISIIRLLRSDKGCPWDQVQTTESIKMSIIEEAYEALDAINSKNIDNFKEELGDLLLQIIFHSEIYNEKKQFTFEDVVDGICKKLIRRHPHVFGDEKVKNINEVNKVWEKIKKEEKKKTYSEIISFDDIPKSLPALFYSYKVQKVASKFGFDWSNKDDVFKKLKEEISEFEAAIATKNIENIKDELGDIFFTLVNLSRVHDLNPEDLLVQNTQKFKSRFKKMVEIINNEGLVFSNLSEDQIDVFWREAKKNLLK